MAKKNVYSLKTVDGDPVRVEEAWKDANGELLTEKVNKADAQTITGLKTFATLPQSSATPTNDADLATKKYSDDLWATRKAQEEKCYQAMKTVTKDFTRTDPVYVRIGDDGEPEIHYTITKANANQLFENLDLKEATLYVHNGKIITTAENLFASLMCKRVFLDSLGSETRFFGFNMCGYVQGLKSVVEFGAFDASKITSLSSAFIWNQRLKVIPAWDFSNVTSFSGSWGYCTALSEFHAYGMKVSFDLHYSALTHDAILEVFNNLSSGVAEGTTLTLGSDKLALMSDDEKAIATEKGWTLA